MFYKNMADWGLHSGTFLHILVSFEKENIYPHYKGIFAPKKRDGCDFKKYLFITAFKWMICWLYSYTYVDNQIN